MTDDYCSYMGGMAGMTAGYCWYMAGMTDDYCWYMTGMTVGIWLVWLELMLVAAGI